MRKNPLNQLTSLLNTYLFIWEKEDERDDKEESFKQSLMQAFPSMAKEIYDADENALGDEYEQILPTTMEEFVSLEDFLSTMYTANAEDVVKEE